METMHIELDIEVEKTIEHLGKSAAELKADLTQHLEQWVNDYLHSLETASQEDVWLQFLDNIDKHAVDTGIEDFSINHEYYLYGGPKRQ